MISIIIPPIKEATNPMILCKAHTMSNHNPTQSVYTQWKNLFVRKRTPIREFLFHGSAFRSTFTVSIICITWILFVGIFGVSDICWNFGSDMQSLLDTIHNLVHVEEDKLTISSGYVLWLQSTARVCVCVCVLGVCVCTSTRQILNSDRGQPKIMNSSTGTTYEAHTHTHIHMHIHTYTRTYTHTCHPHAYIYNVQ